MKKELRTKEIINLGNVLKEARIKSGKTRYQLAKESGLFYQQILDIEDGRKNYTINNLITYLEAFNTEIFFSTEFLTTK